MFGDEVRALLLFTGLLSRTSQEGRRAMRPGERERPLLECPHGTNLKRTNDGQTLETLGDSVTT